MPARVTIELVQGDKPYPRASISIEFTKRHSPAEEAAATFAAALFTCVENSDGDFLNIEQMKEVMQVAQSIRGTLSPPNLITPN